MTIGIIGSGIAGLTAGKILAQAGHEVIVYEKSSGFGGRLATRYLGDDKKLKLDHAASYFTAKSDEFKTFLAELEQKGLVEKWNESLSFYDGENLLEEHPAREKQTHYIAPDGMNSIGKHLSRWVDFKMDESVGGITLIGKNPQKKKRWMLNLSSINVFELDAVIVATPAVQAYGIIQTSQDETAIRRLIREIDEVYYESAFSVLLGYEGTEKPNWKGILCNDDIIQWVCNESSKRDTGTTQSLVVQTNSKFALKHHNEEPDKVVRKVIDRLGEIAGNWAAKPTWAQLHYWRYNNAVTSINKPYMELEDHPAPLALVGDYFQGKGMESAFLSGYRLAHHWLEKYPIDK